MAFLKTMWKNNTKHKKLHEEMVLTRNLQDFVESPIDYHDDEVNDDPIVFNLKYLGFTTMSSEEEKQSKKLKFSRKSQVITTSAIKRVLALSKSQKKLSEVTISISPKGIIAIDQMSDEKIVEVPIHRISYCSIDAAHDTIFSFVSSPEQEETKQKKSNLFGSKESPIGELESNSLEDDEGLVLHAFQCQKRKVAHNVTMTVARSFERAFQIYQQCQMMMSILKDKENSVKSLKNEKQKEESLIDFTNSENQFNANIIEFHPEPSSRKTHWVSFE